MLSLWESALTDVMNVNLPAFSPFRMAERARSVRSAPHLSKMWSRSSMMTMGLGWASASTTKSVTA